MTGAALHHGPDVSQERSIPLELPGLARIVSFASSLGIGADAVLLAGLRVLLSWYSGQWSLAIATARGRRDPHGVPLADSSRDMVRLRLDARPEQAFAALAADSAAELALAAGEAGDAAEGWAADQALTLEVRFELAGPAADPLPGTDAGSPQTANGKAPYELRILLGCDGDAVVGSLSYDARRFGRDQMRLLGEHYRCLIEKAVRYPGTAVGAFEPLTGEERRFQLVEQNATAARYPEATIHALVRAQAAARPDAVALTSRTQRSSYRDLVGRAEALARGLVASGVRPGELVALVLHRGAGRVEAMLAVLFAGAAYLPIEPSAPASRMAFMLSDSGTRWVITDDEPPMRARAGPGVEVLTLSRLAQAGGADLTLPEAGPDQPAYCIYTSGTSGRPKGVVVSHRNVVRLIDNDRFLFRIGPGDVWTMFHSYAFDISVWEVYGCLARGGRLVAVEDDLASDMGRYWQLVKQEGVTVLELTPSAFAPFSEVACADLDRACLRYLFLGGEKLRPRALAAWTQRWPDVTVVNAYGPTEITVRATARILTPDDIQDDVSDIGQPIPTTTVYLMDAETGGRLVPAGSAGEIYVGGAGVTGGYLNRPELSAERFVPDPSGAGLLFRTGDLARYRPDGSLEYMGRRDSQVKLRGYRIELDEITSCLREHPSIADAAVLLVSEASSSSIEAYVRWRGQGSEVSDVRAHLGQLLPEYMIPSRFHVVDRIPLTSNGKLDRQALVALSVPAQPQGGTAGRLPATVTARSLAKIWSELLGRPVDDAESSFFALGGDSLVAMRLAARVAKQMGIDLALREILDHPCLQDLADRIDAIPPQQARSQAPVLLPAMSVQRHASSIQESIWFAERLEPDVPLYNVPIAWRVRGHLDTDVLQRALAILVARHEIMRSRFMERDGRLRQVIDRPWEPPVHYADLNGMPAAERPHAITQRLRAGLLDPFDLAAEHMLRVTLLDFDGADQALLVSTHHLAWDDASTGIFIRELERCYAAALSQTSELPPAGAQYQDFVRAQQAQQADDAGIAYWVELLHGAPAYLPFVPPGRPHDHGTVPVPLRAGLPERLRRLRAQRGVSPFMVLAAAVALLLHSWTGLGDVTFGCPVANRDDEDLAEVLGPCLNMVIMRSRCEPATTVSDVLQATRDWALDMLGYRGAPFETVVSKLAPPRRAGMTPYADVTVNLPSLPDDETALGDARLRLVPIDQWDQEIKFGLSLTFLQDNGELRGVASYRGDRFAREEVERRARSLGLLLDQFPDLLDRRLDELDITLGEPG